LGDFLLDLQGECPEKTSKTPKYGEKMRPECFSRRLVAAGSAFEFSRLSRAVKASFILAARSFSEMFTSYSHRLPFRPASGLRLEIGAKIDKKKTELYFSSHKKKS